MIVGSAGSWETSLAWSSTPCASLASALAKGYGGYRACVSCAAAGRPSTRKNKEGKSPAAPSYAGPPNDQGAFQC